MKGLIEETLRGVEVNFVFRRTRNHNPVQLARYYINRAIFPYLARHAAKSEGEVVIFHPQTLGLPLLRQLVEGRQSTWLYVLDSSVFCIRSYNCLPSESAPCLRCVGNDGSPSRQHDCESIFRSGPFQQFLPSWVSAGKLKLIAQCESQARILRTHFGNETPVAVVPLSVPDIVPLSEAAPRPARRRPLAVYHGAPIHAKGVVHVISLAKIMKDWDFLIPASLGELSHHLGAGIACPPNLILTPMSWSTGLAQQVQNADIVLCPSSWSAPVEGAVLKSLAHNGLVGLYVHDTSFAAEIPADARVSIEPKNLPETAERLRFLIANPKAAEAIRECARSFIRKYASENRSMLAALSDVCVGN